jgi:hypothetical protein
VSQQNTRGSLPAVLLGAMVVAFLITGCTESKRHQADTKLLEATETASRLYARAVSLMDLPPAKVNGKYLLAEPLTHVSDSSTVELPGAMEMHPEARDALAKAESGLTQALREYGRDAGDPEQALAQAMLGNVLMLKAEYLRAVAGADRRQARSLLSMAHRSVSMVELYASLGAYYDRLSALDDRALSAMVSSARQETDKAKADADAVRQDIASLHARAEQLRQANETLIPQARRLRVDSESTGGAKGMELLDQALKLEGQINENVSALAALENALERRQADLSDAMVTLESAQARQRVAETIASTRRGHAGASREELSGIQTSLDKARTQLQTLTSHLAGICEQIGQTDDTAAEAYRAAILRLEAARRLQPRGQDTPTLARLADARWDLAELRDRSLYLRHTNVQLAQRLAAVWSPPGPGATTTITITSHPTSGPAVPGFAQGLLAYVPDPNAALAEAVENYRQSGELYEAASRYVPAQLRWAYQGQAAAAYIALYRLSHDPEALTKARENLDQALQDKRESPFLASVVELEKLLQSSSPRPERERTTRPQ